MLLQSCASKKQLVSTTTETSRYFNFYLANSLSQNLSDTRTDIAYLIENANTKNISVPTFFLSNKAEGKIEPSFVNELKDESSESFYIQADKNEVWIYGKNQQALSNGLYYYLEKLGFRFFMPGDLWTTHPELDFDIILNQAVVPSFRNRVIYGQGGFAISPMDPKNNRKNEFYLWQKRNRLGQEFKLGGHSWQEFNIKNKELLLKNPAYLATVDGKPVPYRPNTKFNISNPKLRALFIKDRIEAYEKLLAKYGPDDYRSFGICVDPSDGSGHDESPASLAMGSVSDRVFFLANEVAKELRKKYPKAWVYLYAYNMHAEVPKIALEKNVYVQVIPYAFQREAAPEVLLNDWAKKTNNLGIYDYINLPDGHLDKPVHDWNEIPEKINTWKQLEIESVLFESTNANGPAGLANYLAARLMWDHSLSVDNLVDEFFKLNFENGSTAMQSMVSRWSKQYTPLFEIPMALKDLESATKQTTDESAKKRINYFKSYVHYLSLLQEVEQSEGAIKEDKINVLITYMESTYDNYMVHSSWIRHLLLTRSKSVKLKNQWNTRQVQTSNWRSVSPITQKKIDADFSDDIRQNPLTVNVPTFNQERNFKLSPANARSASTKTSFEMDISNEMVWNAEANEVISMNLSGRIIPRGDKIKSIIYVTLMNQDKEVVFAENYSKLKLNETIRLQAPEKGIYDIKFRVLNARLIVDLSSNANLAFKYPIKLVRYPERLYVHIPKEQTSIYYQSNKTKISFFNQAGNQVNARKLENGLSVIDIDEKDRNTFWSFNASFKNFEFLNLDRRYYINKMSTLF